MEDELKLIAQNYIQESGTVEMTSNVVDTMLSTDKTFAEQSCFYICKNFKSKDEDILKLHNEISYFKEKIRYKIKENRKLFQNF